jgi:hypothetical protein
MRKLLLPVDNGQVDPWVLMDEVDRTPESHFARREVARWRTCRCA